MKSPGAHRRAFTFDRRIRARPFHDEAQRRRHVAMARGDLARKDQLQSRIEAAGRLGASRQTGILEHQHAALGLVCGQQPAGFHQQRPQLLVPPQHRNRAPASASARSTSRAPPTAAPCSSRRGAVEGFPLGREWRFAEITLLSSMSWRSCRQRLVPTARLPAERHRCGTRRVHRTICPERRHDVSPAWIGATPSGVPVKTMSPGCSV